MKKTHIINYQFVRLILSFSHILDSDWSENNIGFTTIYIYTRIYFISFYKLSIRKNSRYVLRSDNIQLVFYLIRSY